MVTASSSLPPIASTNPGASAPKGTWYWTGDTCPTCKGETEFRVGEPDDEAETYDAERCRRCRWIAEFHEDHEHTIRQY